MGLPSCLYLQHLKENLYTQAETDTEAAWMVLLFQPKFTAQVHRLLSVNLGWTCRYILTLLLIFQQCFSTGYLLHDLLCARSRNQALETHEMLARDVEADIIVLKHISRILGHWNDPALIVSHFKASFWALNKKRCHAHRPDRKAVMGCYNVRNSTDML